MGPVHAFDYVMTLMSFVYALAITHLLATTGDVIGAWSRVRFSWLNAAWMFFSLLGVLAWWIGLWGMGDRWSMAQVATFFLLAAVLYVQARLVCVRVAGDGIVDMQAFHSGEGVKYMACYALLTGLTIAVNLTFFGRIGLPKNYAVAGMFVCALAGTLFRRQIVQTAAAVVLAGLWLWYFSTLQGTLS
jgi:hypothetical protein